MSRFKKIELISLKIISILTLLMWILMVPFLIFMRYINEGVIIWDVLLVGKFICMCLVCVCMIFLSGWLFISTNNPAQKYNIFTINRRWPSIDLYDPDEEDNEIINKKVRNKKRKRNIKKLLEE